LQSLLCRNRIKLTGRHKKELKAILRNFKYPGGDSADNSKVAVALLSEKIKTSVICVSAKRLQSRKDAALGNVLVHFEEKTHKHFV